MKLSLFDYNLPKSRIAQTPASPRDSSRLLIYDRKTKKTVHDKFLNLPNYLEQGDVLVFNNSKVMPARLLGNKDTGGKAEALLLNEIKAGSWEVLLGCRKPKIGLKLLFSGGLEAIVIKSLSAKTWQIEFNIKGSKFSKLLQKIGELPLPPYISPKQSIVNGQKSNVKKQYQTIYAKQMGSAAAPTAGLHFTNRLFKKLEKRGVQKEFVTLHVGLGTFNSVDTENIKDYKIHSEMVEVDSATINRLQKAKKEGRRIIAVGTTSIRTLEAVMSKIKSQRSNVRQLVDIYIYPGYKFKFVDAMITNFHLPKSSLLMLVSAFIGRKTMLKLYRKAIKMKYRFFSFGDGMFLK